MKIEEIHAGGDSTLDLLHFPSHQIRPKAFCYVSFLLAIRVLYIVVQHNKKCFVGIAVNKFFFEPYLATKFGPGATKHAPTYLGSSGI